MSIWVGWDSSETTVRTASVGSVGSVLLFPDKMDDMVCQRNGMENEENEMRMRSITKWREHAV